MSAQLQVTGEAKIRDIQGPVVANSGVITALDGAASQYVRGDGTLADFPTSTGGGSSVSYYLNSSVSQGTIDGNAYRELSKEPIIGSGTDIAISSNGYVANYITDANDPDVILLPGGNFNCEFYFSVNNNTGSPTTYAELYKYDGSTFTLLGSSSGVPESINQGTTIAPYYFAIPVATATLATTDRLAIRIYVNVDGRTVTLHTENSHLCQVVTTLSKGMVSLNNLTDQSQYLTTGTSGTDFNIVSSGDTHTFNIPSASSSNRGLITTGTQTIAGNKTFSGLTNFNNSIGVEYFAYFDGDGTTGNGGILIKQYSGAILAGVDYTTLFATPNQLGLNFGGAYNSFLQATSLTANRTYTLPDLSGTLALTSDLSNYVPYTGATGAVNLGAYDLTVNSVKVGRGGGSISTNTALGTSTLNSNTTGSENTALGWNSMPNNTTGSSNTGIGGGSLQQNTTGSSNTALGYATLVANTTGSQNVAIGVGSLQNNTTASYNVAIGTSALRTNTIGSQNSALGNSALYYNTSGSNNTAIGNVVLQQNTTGDNNTAIGSFSSYLNTTGSNNTSIGASALSANTTGEGNTAIGGSSLYSNTTAFYNTAIGFGSLNLNTTGQSNVGVGATSLGVNTTGQYNVAIGRSASNANTTGNYNTALGGQALANVTTGSQNIAIGYNSGGGITTGSQNTIIGTVTGLSSSLSNNIILADGGGNIRYQWNGTNNVFGNPISGTSATFNTNSTSNAGFFQINDATTTLGNSFATVHRNANDGNGRFSLSRWQVQNTSGLSQSAFIGAQAVTGAANYSPNLILGVSNGASSYTTYLTIASTGAATFSSSVSIPSASSAGAGYFNFTYLSTQANSRTWRICNDYDFFGDFQIQQSTTQTGATFAKILGFSASGAATFSSSVLINGTSGGNAISSLNVKTDGTKILAIEAIAPSGNKSIYIKPVDSGIHLISSNYLSSGPYLSLALSARENTSDFVLTNGGNVLIGTTTDSGYKLNVNGTIGTSGSISINSGGGLFATGDVLTTSGRLLVSNGNQTAGSETGSILLGNRGYFSTSDIGAARISAVSTGANWYNGTSLAFYTNPGPDVTSTGAVERMRITSVGEVIVVNNQTSGVAGTNFRVYANAANSFFRLGNNTSNSLNIQLTRSDSATMFSVDGHAGTGYLNASAWTYGSDLRIKENISDVKDGIDVVLKLKPKHFDYINGTKDNLGFIAQDIQEVIPQAVTEINEEGQLGLKTDFLIPYLVKAIQEQNEIITKQCQAIEELKAEIEELKNK